MYQFDEQVAHGAEIIRGIVGVEAYEQLTPSTPMKLLFSTITQHGITSSERLVKDISKRITGAKLVTNGLLIEDKLYPFSNEFQGIFHRAFLQTFVQDQKVSQDILEKLLSFHQIWKDYYISIGKVSVTKELKGAHNQKLSSIRKKFRQGFLGNSKFDFITEYISSLYPHLEPEQLESFEENITEFRLKQLNPLIKEIREIRARLEVEQQEERRELNARIKADMESASWIESIPQKGQRMLDKRNLKLYHERNMKNLMIVLQQRLFRLKEDWQIKITNEFGIHVGYDMVLAEAEKLSHIKFETRLVEKEIMDSEDIHDYHSFSVTNKDFGKRIVELVKEFNRTSDTQVAFAEMSSDCEVFKRIPIRYTKKGVPVRSRLVHSARINMVLEKLKLSIKVKCGRDYYDKYSNISDHALIPKNTFKGPVEYNHDRLLNHMYWLLDVIFDGKSEKAKDIVNEYVEYCHRHYGSLMIRYVEAERGWGKMPSSEVLRLQKITGKLTRDFEKGLGETVNMKITNEFNTIIKLITNELCGKVTKSGNNIILIPTGLLVGTKETGIVTAGYSPVDERIQRCLTTEQWKTWQYAWSNFYKEDIIDTEKKRIVKRIESFDIIIRRLMNDFVQTQMDNNRHRLPDYERRILELRDHYQLKIPRTVDSNNGHIVQPIIEPVVDILEEFLPIYGKYFSSISTSVRAIAGSSLLENLKKIIAGTKGDGIYSLMRNHLDGKKLQIDAMVLSHIIDEAGGLTDNIHQLLSMCIGVLKYSNLQSHQLEEFHDLVRDRINVSKIDLFVLCDRRIDCPIERREIMSRILFATEFSKYVSGDSELSDFFNKLEEGA